MQTLANYDPYAIEEIEFFVHKKSKYTTLKSIIVTLAIFALTIYLNMGVIQHLWITRSELPLVSSSRKMSLEPFTSAYFCVLPKDDTIPLPKTALINLNFETNETTKTFTVTEKFNTNPEVIKMAEGRQFVCYDIQGAIVNQVNHLKMLVYAASGSEFDFMVKSYSQKQLIGDKEEPANFIYFKAKEEYSNSKIIYKIQQKKIGAIYKDKLLINYEPQKVTGFGQGQAHSANVGEPQASTITFFSELYVPFDLTDQYELARYNIADILGRILSWFSVFVLICAFVVSPVLDFNYKVELAQKLYDNQKLNSIDISLMSYFKYLLSKITGKLFREHVLDTAFEQLDKDLDLLNLIKRQTLMKKLIKENQTLNLPHKEPHNANSQLNFDFSEVLLTKEAEMMSEHSDSQKLTQNQDSTSNECPLVTEADEKSGDNILSRAIKSFDISEVEISLISNKGEGYKTSWNTIITVVFLAGVVWFILFAGLFELSPTYKVETISLLRDESVYPKATLNPEDIIFFIKKLPTSNFNLDAVLLDENDQIIENITLLQGPDCHPYILGLNESTTDNWLCLSDPITLQNNGLQTKVKLGLRLVYDGFGFSATDIEVKLRQYNLIDNQFVEELIYLRHLYASSTNYLYGSQSLINDDSDNEDGLQFYWTLNKYRMTSQTVFKGLSIDLSSEFIRVQKTSPSIWDVINNAWGIVVVAFTVFLSKITRYLNVKKRQNITKNEQNQNRNDIVAIISTQYKLISTVFYDQLRHVKYFYKSKINDVQGKDN